MCGICGFVGQPDPNALQRMADVLTHRGPDDTGVFTEGTVSLAHRRLSIVDLACGHQPMASPDGNIVLVYNGEIYNHPRLKQQLEAQGHRYTTRCDTESLIHAYQEFGTECLTHLNGMFSFVLYDRRRNVLFGARDRMGQKPLYYTREPFGSVRFAFASELKSLRQHPEIAPRKSLSTEGLISYLLNDYVHGPRCIDQGIARLEPGSAFLYGLPGSEHEGFRQWRYWHLQIGELESPSISPSSMDQIENDIVDLLAASIERQLMADVPLGVFLSGGIDSSAIVALLSNRFQRRTKTFSIGFQESSFDESECAAAMARYFGTQHISRCFDTADLVQRVPRVAAMLDEPFADPSILPSAMLSELAAEHVKVALGGDGADELFAGYDPFRAIPAARWYYGCVPRQLDTMVHKCLTACLPETSQNLSTRFKVSRFLRGAVDSNRRVAVWMGAFTQESLRQLLPEVSPQLIAEQTEYRTDAAAYRPNHEIDHALDFYQRVYLPDDILVKMDRASMLHSLEVRSPFLDTELVDYVNRLPHRLKFHRGKTKWIFKRALQRQQLLPREVICRRKKGFGIPVARWMREELQSYFREALIDDWPSNLPMFNQAEISRIWNEHVQHAANHYKELWALFMLSQWAKHAS